MTHKKITQKWNQEKGSTIIRHAEMPVKDNYVVFVTGMLYNSIGADTVLKLGGTNSGAKRRKFF